MAEKPTTIRVYHYIVDTMSLCRRYGFYRGELAPFKIGPPRDPKDCAECYRQAVKRHEQKRGHP